ncbi:hypothetical protein K450DRAFT_245176 [Umbelopsis ramanniana AG]|uniref:Uncharacterized protein n=1 Tax=Umbelopsis ramanniana AG TaxID=1314678 RepID=A0AAD5HE15_UMBRA|nr:uncharacterized protein K450DRAFT_245176 [Umbelopsis ramanniana AG]KAI8578718.1 hypothetical protein K450DRAFT_245176 [Umbelopsis ramanniana AG]
MSYTGATENPSSLHHRQDTRPTYHDDSSDDGFYDYLSEDDDDYDEIAYLRHKLNRLELDNKFLSQQNTHLGKELSFNRYTTVAMRNIVSQKESSLQAASQELEKAHFRIRMLETLLTGRKQLYDIVPPHSPSGMDQSLRSQAIHALKKNHRSTVTEDESALDEDDSDYDHDVRRTNIQSVLPIRSSSPSDDIPDSRRSSQDISASGSDSDESSVHQSSPPSRPSDDKVNIWNKNEDLFADEYVDLVGWHDDEDTNQMAQKSVKPSFINHQPIVTSL